MGGGGREDERETLRFIIVGFLIQAIKIILAKIIEILLLWLKINS